MAGKIKNFENRLKLHFIMKTKKRKVEKLKIKGFGKWKNFKLNAI